MDIAIHGSLDASMAKQLLQNLWLHTAFDGPGGICVAKGVHAEPLDAGFIAELIQVSVIGTVLGRFTGAPVDEDQICQKQMILPT